MARELGVIKNDWNAVVSENNRRIAVETHLYQQLDAEFGTHDRAELERILTERKRKADEATAAYEAALNDVDKYVTEKKEALGI